MQSWNPRRNVRKGSDNNGSGTQNKFWARDRDQLRETDFHGSHKTFIDSLWEIANKVVSYQGCSERTVSQCCMTESCGECL